MQPNGPTFLPGLNGQNKDIPFPRELTPPSPPVPLPTTDTAQVNLSWQRMLFPYLEVPQNLDYQVTQTYFLCPSDSRGGVAYGGGAGFTAYGLTWYVPLDVNVYGDDLGTIVTGDRIIHRRGLKLMDVADGTSNTVCVGERPPSPPDQYPDLYWGWWDYGTLTDTRVPVRSTQPFYSRERNAGPDCPPGPAVFGPGSVVNQCSFNSVWSNHPGGALFLFDDGSVRFLTYGVTGLLPGSGRSILEAMVTINGGEPVPGDTF
jgi:hypothetical protein